MRDVLPPPLSPTDSTRALARGAFSHATYTIRRPFFTLFGRTFSVYAPGGELVLFVRRRLLTLRDAWTIYADASEQVPLLRLQARQVLALNTVTDVFDAPTGERLGTVRARGLRSLVRDRWEVLDEGEQVIGHFEEDSNALLRRLLPLMRGHWHLALHGQRVASLDQVFRWFVKEFTLELYPEGARSADPRFVVAVAMLALMREIERESR